MKKAELEAEIHALSSQLLDLARRGNVGFVLMLWNGKSEMVSTSNMTNEQRRVLVGEWLRGTPVEPPAPAQCDHQPVGGNDGTWCFKCYEDLTIRPAPAKCEWHLELEDEDGTIHSGPPCGKPATSLSCDPVDSLTCDEHKCRCAKPLPTKEPKPEPQPSVLEDLADHVERLRAKELGKRRLLLRSVESPEDLARALRHDGYTEEEAAELIRMRDETKPAPEPPAAVPRSEVEALLRRIIKYAREDRAQTPGVTRLARALAEAEALLAKESR